MDAGYTFGYILGAVLIGGLLPFAFISHGKSHGKTWALVVGIVLGVLTALGSIFSFHIGNLIAIAFWVAGLIFVKPKAPKSGPTS